MDSSHISQDNLLLARNLSHTQLVDLVLGLYTKLLDLEGRQNGWPRSQKLINEHIRNELTGIFGITKT